MTSRDFVFWLQGYAELTATGVSDGLTSDQWDCVRRHLNMVFAHEIDPSHGTPEHVAKLQELHDGAASKLTDLEEAVRAARQEAEVAHEKARVAVRMAGEGDARNVRLTC